MLKKNSVNIDHQLHCESSEEVNSLGSKSRVRLRWNIPPKVHSAAPMAVRIFLSSACRHRCRRRRCSLRYKDLSGRMKETGGRFARTDRLFGVESSERREGWSRRRRIGKGRTNGKGMSQGIISERITFLLFSRRETPICSTVHIPRTMRSRAKGWSSLSLSVCVSFSFSSYSPFRRNFLPKLLPFQRHSTATIACAGHNV